LLITHETLLPAGWPRPRGYANGIAAHGRMVFTAGIIGWDETEQLVSPDLVEQFGQVLKNTLAVLGEAGAGPQHVVRMTWFITSRDEYLARLKEIGNVYQSTFGRHFPAMAVVQVSGLIEPEARIEIETTAVIPGEHT
jgi:enamine deaminase RidA (YjgF/YER057c/UK114 family)